MRRKGNRHKLGSAYGTHRSQGPLGIPPGHPRCWFRFGTFSFERAHGPAPKQWFFTLRADAGEYKAGNVRSRGPQWALRMAP